MPRYFIGIPVPDSYHAKVEALAATLDARLSSKVRWIKPDNAHITLKFIGHVEEEQLSGLKAVLGAISFPAFFMRVGGCAVIPNERKPRTIWTGATKGARSCAELAKAVADAMEPIGFAREERPFKCHLTLGRIKWVGQDDWRALLDEVNEIWPGFKVDRFILWQSELRQDGPIYTIIDEYLLLEEDGT